MKQDIRIDLDYEYGKIIPLYNVSSIYIYIYIYIYIVNRNMKNMLDNDIVASDDEHEEHNVLNYDIFNKDVFHVYQQVETIEISYSIVVSKRVTLAHQYPTIDEFLN